MAIKHVVLDWNGTLCDMTDDSTIMRRLAVAVLRDNVRQVARGRLWRVVNLVRFIRGRFQLRAATKRFSAGQIGLPELYAPFNRDMLRGLPVAEVERIAAAYGVAHAHLIDQRLLVPALAARDAGATLTIFSAAYDGGVRAILAAAGVDIDDVVSNKLETADGRAVGFTGLYRDDKSGDFAREFIENRGWLASEIVYAGDAGVDEPVARLLPPGNFVVPFLAESAFRAHMRAAHGASTPEAADDVSLLLRG
jgi:phosphoserine phosphatase